MPDVARHPAVSKRLMHFSGNWSSASRMGRRWTFGRRKNPQPTKFWRKQKSWKQAWRETRYFVMLIAIATLYAIYQSAGFYEPPSFLAMEPEPVDQYFTRCGRGRNHGCVTDGDSIKISERKIRVVGIDAPELEGRCTYERVLAEQATERMLSWVNAGPFEMVGRVDEPTDRYGRDLRTLRRQLPGGAGTEYAAEVMRDAGLARRYSGGWREGWCD